LGDSGTSEPKALVLVIGSDWLGGSFAAFAIVDEPPTAFLALADHGVTSDNLRTLSPSPILVNRIFTEIDYLFSLPFSLTSPESRFFRLNRESCNSRGASV
jgi:hypothetical protein